MSTYPILYNEPDLLKTKTTDYEIKDLKYKTEKHDFEKFSKSLKIDNEYYKKKYKSLNKKKVFMIVSQNLIGVGGLSVGSGLTISGIAPVGLVTVGSISFLSSISTLITNDYFSKIKIRYTKLRDCNNTTTLRYEEKTLKESMVDTKIHEKESEKLRSIYNHYINKEDEIKKSTQCRFEEIFGNSNPEDTISPKQIAKLNFFSAKIMGM